MVFYITRGNYAVTTTEITDALGYTDIVRLSQTQTVTGSKTFTTNDVNIAVNILPTTPNVRNLGSTATPFQLLRVGSFVSIIEGYATGIKPAGVTDQALLFAVPTAGGKTELRCSFQTGGSIVIATEP